MGARHVLPFHLLFSNKLQKSAIGYIQMCLTLTICYYEYTMFGEKMMAFISGMSEKELTRLEMATLLCVNDRQHSQLMDNMPEKSGGTGHGKELFQITLEEV